VTTKLAATQASASQRRAAFTSPPLLQRVEFGRTEADETADVLTVHGG